MRGRYELAASKGWLRVFILYISGKPCAYWDTTAYCGILYGEYIGYDPAYSRYSPGMYLMLSVIGELCDQKTHDITQIDFGQGDAEYKSVMTNLIFEAGEVQIYGRTLRGLGIKVFSTPLIFADRLAKKILSKTKLLVKAKRLSETACARCVRKRSFPQGDVEKRTGLLRRCVSRVENGHTNPAVETLEKWPPRKEAHS